MSENENIELEDYNFRVDSTGWKKITNTSDDEENYLENPEGDIREILEGSCKTQQLFTWEAAIRETAKAGKRMPTDKEWLSLVKMTEDIPNLAFAGCSYGEYIGGQSNHTSLWSSTENRHEAWCLSAGKRDSYINKNGYGMIEKKHGFSVRCLKNGKDDWTKVEKKIKTPELMEILQKNFQSAKIEFSVTKNLISHGVTILSLSGKIQLGFLQIDNKNLYQQIKFYDPDNGNIVLLWQNGENEKNLTEYDGKSRRMRFGIRKELSEMGLL